MGTRISEAASITAQNSFTDPLSLDGLAGSKVAISVSGTFTATVTLQRSFDDGESWHDVESWEAVAEQSYDVDAPQLLRLGVKTGDFSDGTAVVRLTTQG